MKTLKVLTLIIFFGLVSCQSGQQPIVIEKIPENKMREDMTVEEYFTESTRYVIELKSYIDQLVNQIKHKTRYIDLNENKSGNDKSDEKSQ